MRSVVGRVPGRKSCRYAGAGIGQICELCNGGFCAIVDNSLIGFSMFSRYSKYAARASTSYSPSLIPAKQGATIRI